MDDICVVLHPDEVTFSFARFAAAALWISIALVAPGCSPSPYELAPVHGTVTLDGKALSRAKVMFAPVEVDDNPNPGKPAFGLVQDDGSYALTTYRTNDGAVVGQHWVSIVKLTIRPRETKPVRSSPGNGLQFDRLTMPQKVTVVADSDNQIDLKLTSQDVARFGVVMRD